MSKYFIKKISFMVVEVIIICFCLSSFVFSTNTNKIKILAISITIIIIIVLMHNLWSLIISIKSYSSYICTKGMFPLIKIKTITSDYEYSSKDELISYYKEHSKYIINNNEWRKKALIYYWRETYNTMELCANNDLYKAALWDTFLHQNYYIVITTMIIRELATEINN